MSTSRLSQPPRRRRIDCERDNELRCLAASFTIGGGITGHSSPGRPSSTLDDVVAGLALDIVDVQTHRAVVAVEQEARQRRRQHQDRAGHDVGGGAAELGRGPRHRHHARGAGELRNVEAGACAVPSAPTVTMPE